MEILKKLNGILQNWSFLASNRAYMAHAF